MRTVAAIPVSTSIDAGLMAVYARTLAMSKGDLPHALAIAEERGLHARVISVLKAAVAVGTTTDPTWAKPLVDYDSIIGAFVSTLRNQSLFYRLLDQGMVRLPFRTRVGSVVSAIGAGIVGEGKPTPLSALQLAGAVLEEQKAAAMVVMTDDLLRASAQSAEALVGRELRRAVTGAVDAEFLSLITDGSTPTAVSAGVTAAAAHEDLRALLDLVQPTAESRLMWAMAPDVARAAATLVDADGSGVFPGMSPVGGSLLNLPAMVSDQIATGTIGLIDAAGIAGESETITIDSSNQALVQMDSAPTSPVTSSTVLMSLWQHNMTSFLAKAYFGAERLRDEAYATVTGVNWGGDLPEEG